MQCRMNDIGNEDCSHSEDVGVICQGMYEDGTGGSSGFETRDAIEAGDFRLVLNDEEQIMDREYTRVSGRIEYRYEGTWGTVCDDAFDNNENGARVACNSLGLPSDNARFQQAEPAGDDVPTWLDQVACEGYEMSLLDCQRN